VFKTVLITMVPVSSLPSPFSPSPQQGGDSLDIGAPDLSHLSEEERQIILQVLQRQKDEERKEEEIAQKGNQELWDIERQIQERKENAQKLIGTQDDAICQICQKTKFADGIGHKVKEKKKILLEPLTKNFYFFPVFLLSIAILCSLWGQNNKQK